ncbi:alpha/beta fold hydrolase [Nonomuraea sp. LPB2021202275-12-8]|uniref:alpha/beta fold hydrolase n=1 Tax=Nonomuraea sp. LPB2021202275-12-8 TaxID=3120159 RepID=UPI00300C980F
MKSATATGHVTSADGTTIGYHRLGDGPALVVLHGQMESAQSHRQIAEALAGAHTVYLPDRRGRGLSGPYGAEHTVEREVEDLDAVLAATGAQHVFGVSVGALVLLRAATSLPAIRKAAVYEPPLFADGPAPTAWLTRYEREMAEGRVPAALITAMQAAQLGPSFLRFMPRRLLEFLSARMTAGQDRKARPGDVTMRMLAPTLRHEARVVAELAQTQRDFGAVRADTLLLGGAKSPAYLKAALDALERVLPHTRRVEFAGLDHSGSGNTDLGGRPDVVADELRRFFA